MMAALYHDNEMLTALPIRDAMRLATVALVEAQENAVRIEQSMRQSGAEELSQARLEAKTLCSRTQTAFPDARNKVESILRLDVVERSILVGG